MSYSAFNALVSGKRPVWLYYMRKGATEVYLTSSGEDFNAATPDFFIGDDFFAEEDGDAFTQIWTATPMTRTAIRVTSAIGRAEVKIVMPQSHEFARLFIGDPGYEDNEVVIYHTYTNDPDAEVVTKFRGRVVETRAFWKTITLACENRFTAMRNKALPEVVQRPCRHALYNQGCNLNIADWEIPGTATDYTAPVLTVTEAGEQADGYFSGGIVTWNGNRQFIIKHSGTSLTLLAALPGLSDDIDASGSSYVSIAPGCNLSMATCKDRFDNLDNYGGFPWMSDSPWDGRNPFV